MGRSPSLRSRHRQSLQKAYRARGHKNNNLWLVFSSKTNRDWLLTSDRQFIHWICNLEIDHTVSSFDLISNDIVLPLSRSLSNTWNLAVQRTNGSREWHEVICGEPTSTEDFQERSAAAEKQGMQYRLFSDVELAPLADLAVRWNYILSFSSALRELHNENSLVSLQTTLLSRKFGKISDILTDLEGHDEMVVLGLVVKLITKGLITFDSTAKGFGPETKWIYHG